MKESKIRRGKLAVAGVLVVVLFLPMVGAITGTGQGIAYGQARDPALDLVRYTAAECVKLRGDLQRASKDLHWKKTLLDFDKAVTEATYGRTLFSLVIITNLRDQIAGLDAAEVFLPDDEKVLKVKDALQEMRKRAEAQLTKEKKEYETLRGLLAAYISDDESDEAGVNELERAVADLRRKSSAAGCDLPPLGSLISFLPAPSALGAPLPPARRPTPPPTTQVPGSVTRVPPKQPTPGPRAGSLQLVEVTPEDPCRPWKNEFPTCNSGQIIKRTSFMTATYQWTPPPPQVGPEGFTTTMSVSEEPNPGGPSATGLNLNGGGFVIDPMNTPPNATLPIGAPNQPLSGSLTVTVKPPKNPSGDYYLSIGVYWGPGFTYHYRVVR